MEKKNWNDGERSRKEEREEGEIEEDKKTKQKKIFKEEEDKTRIRRPRRKGENKERKKEKNKRRSSNRAGRYEEKYHDIFITDIYHDITFVRGTFLWKCTKRVKYFTELINRVQLDRNIKRY